MDLLPDVGDPAVDVTLVDGDGVRVQLSSQWADRPAVLVFLRYFGCSFCQAQVVGLRRDRERFDATGARVVLIGQGGPGDRGAFGDPALMPFTVLFDPDRAAFRAYGLEHARALQVLAPKTALPWMRLQLHSETRHRGLHGGSLTQLAGTFIVDQTGEVRMAYRSRHVAESPENQAILDVLWRITVGGTLSPGTDVSATPTAPRPVDEAREVEGSRRSARS
ncbi:MAG: SelL-related redox protein [Actinomycetota bacterium]